MQRVAVPVSGGLDGDTDPYLLRPPALQFARNVLARRGGALEKAPGGTSLGTPSGVGSPGTLLRHRDQVVAVGRSGSSFLRGDNSQWKAHATFGQAQNYLTEWVPAIQERGAVLSTALAHNGGYTAIVASVLRDVTASSDQTPYADLQACCVILDSSDNVVWGPYYLRDIRVWPRVEPITVSGTPRFVFFGLEMDIDGSTTPQTIRAFQANPLAPSTPSPITVDTCYRSNLGSNQPQFWYDSHGAGDTATAYITYYSDTDAAVVVNRIDGVNVFSPYVTSTTSRTGNYAVWHDTTTSTVLAYASQSATIYALSEGLGTVTSHGGAGTYNVPLWYEHEGDLFLSGMQVNQTGSAPSTPSFAGSAAHVQQSYDLDPQQVGSDGPVLWFHHRKVLDAPYDVFTDASYHRLAATVHDGTPASEEVTVAVPLLESRLGSRELLNLYGQEYNVPQTDSDASGRVLVPWAVRSPAAKPFEGRASGDELWQTREGGPYGGDRVIGFLRISEPSSKRALSVMEHSGTSVVACGSVLGYDGHVFCDTPGPPWVSDYDDGNPPSPTSHLYYLDTITTTTIREIEAPSGYWGFVLVLVYTDRNGVEWRSAPSMPYYHQFISWAGLWHPRISILLSPSHQRVLRAGGSFDVEMYTTQRSSQANIIAGTGYATGFSAKGDVVNQFYLCQRTPLQEDAAGFFVPDMLQREYRGEYAATVGASPNPARIGPTRPAIPLFTDSGELPPLPPPASTAAATAGNYAFLVPSEFPRELWHSKPLELGRAPEWNPALVLYAPGTAGEIRGVGAVGDRLMLLCERGVWELFVGAGGPDASGAGAFQALRKIHSEDGCLGQHTVVETPQGLFYVSSTGPKLVTDAGVRDIGKPLSGLLDPSAVLSAAYHESQHEVWVFSSDGTHFVLNLDRGVWTDLQYEGTSGVEVGGSMHRMTANGDVHVESSATALDDGTAKLARITTGWVDLGDLQGFKRFKRLSALLRIVSGSTGSISIRIAYDYDDTVVDTMTFLASEFTDADQHPKTGHFVVRPTRQKAEAVKITIQEGLEDNGETTTSDLVWALAGLELKVQGKEGLVKLYAEGKQ